MSGVFNTGLNFWQFIGFFVLAVISIIAIRISFDINKFLERRDKKMQQKLKNACTHMIMEDKGGDGDKPLFVVHSLFESPPGTCQWQCQRCGLIKNNNDDFNQRAEYFAKHPDVYLEQQKRFQKLLKKSGMI